MFIEETLCNSEKWYGENKTVYSFDRLVCEYESCVLDNVCEYHSYKRSRHSGGLWGANCLLDKLTNNWHRVCNSDMMGEVHGAKVGCNRST